MKAQFSRMYWVQVVLTAFQIAFVVVILNIVLFFLVSHMAWQITQAEEALQVILWVNSILAILLTLGGGVWVARKVEREAPLHGLLVGLLAALIVFCLSSGFQGEFYLLNLATFVLMVGAGWLGGMLDSRRQKRVQSTHL